MTRASGSACSKCTRSCLTEAAFALAMNGDLFDFARMRYDLLEQIPPALSSRIEGTTDSEWVYALVLAQLPEPFEPMHGVKDGGGGTPSARDRP